MTYKEKEFEAARQELLKKWVIAAVNKAMLPPEKITLNLVETEDVLQNLFTNEFGHLNASSIPMFYMSIMDALEEMDGAMDINHPVFWIASTAWSLTEISKAPLQELSVEP